MSTINIITIKYSHGKKEIFHYGWLAETRFEDILNFIKFYGNESACDCSVDCRNGTALIYYERWKENSYISRMECIYLNVNLLFEMLKLLKE